jgi:hypothetical protein
MIVASRGILLPEAEQPGPRTYANLYASACVSVRVCVCLCAYVHCLHGYMCLFLHVVCA